MMIKINYLVILQIMRVLAHLMLLLWNAFIQYLPKKVYKVILFVILLFAISSILFYEVGFVMLENTINSILFEKEKKGVKGNKENIYKYEYKLSHKKNKKKNIKNKNSKKSGSKKGIEKKIRRFWLSS